MKIQFSREAFEQFSEWEKLDRKVFRKLKSLIINCQRAPFEGLGKPEPLRHLPGGWWSRRITDEHRLIYRIVGQGEGQVLEIHRCRGHYQ